MYDEANQQWIMSDSVDARRETLPASTFKIINLLIALETKVIKDENQVVRWVGEIDTVRYGYRPDIYHDMTVREAFEKSAGWVFVELAKRIGRDQYRQYLATSHYGNGNLSEPGIDFWNFGTFGISPIEQVNFLRAVYAGKSSFSARSVAILKRVMITESGPGYTIRAKTGWTRPNGQDVGWWVGCVERADNRYFFATRVVKSRSSANPGFAECRKEITRQVLRQLKAI